MTFARSEQQRIAFIATSDISVASHLDGLSGYLSAQGADVTLISSDSGLLSVVAERNGCRSISVPMEREPSPVKDLLSLCKLMVVLWRIRPDAVVYGTPKAALLGALASWLLRIPRRVLIIHGLRIETLTGNARRIQWLLDRIASVLSRDVIAVGRGVASKAVDLRLVSRLPQVLGAGSAQGIDTNRFELGDGTRDPGSEYVVGFVGRVTADKGIDSLVEAFLRLTGEGRRLSLHLVGELEGWATLKEETRNTLENHPGILLLGGLEQPEVAMMTFDALCLPTRREGLPTVLLEAASMGIPIIATRATGVRDIVNDDTAELVDIGDSVALAAAIARTMDDGVEARSKASLAKQHVRRRFANAVVWRNWGEFLLRSSAKPAPRRVLWLSKGIDQGGAETLLLAMARSTKFNEFDLHVGVSLDRHLGLSTQFEQAGVIVHRLGGRSTLDWRWVGALWRLVQSGQFDVVHAHSPLPAAIARLAVKCMGQPRPRMVTTEHAMSALYAPPTRLANFATLHLDDARLAVSDAVAKSHTLPWRAAAEVVVHAPTATAALSRAAAREQLGLSADAEVLMTIANFRPEKNLALMVRAFSRVVAAHPNAHLVLVGEGRSLDSVRSAAAESDAADRIHFVGRVDSAARLLLASDAGVLSSDTEGLPVFVMECLQLGIPVVATDVGGVGELVSSGWNGLLVKPDDEDGLAQAMSTILESADLRAIFSLNALESGGNLSLDVCCETHLRIYDEVRRVL